MSKLSFSDGLALFGIVLAIILVVLDKAGKLKPGPTLFLLLVVAFGMTLPLALGNSWASSGGSDIAKATRGLLGVFLCGVVFSSIAVWISSSDTGGTGLPDDKLQSNKPDPVIEPSYNLIMFGLPLKIVPYASTFIIRVRQNRTVEGLVVNNPESRVLLWPTKKTLWPAEAVGDLQLANHGDMSVFNVLYSFKVNIGGSGEPGGTTSVFFSLPLFNLSVGQQIHFYIVNQSKMGGVIQLSDVAVAEIQGSKERRPIKVQPRSLTFFDKIPMMQPSWHKWSGDQIMPPLDINKKR